MEDGPSRLALGAVASLVARRVISEKERAVVPGTTALGVVLLQSPGRAENQAEEIYEPTPTGGAPSLSVSASFPASRRSPVSFLDWFRCLSHALSLFLNQPGRRPNRKKLRVVGHSVQHPHPYCERLLPFELLAACQLLSAFNGFGCFCHDAFSLVDCLAGAQTQP